MRKWMFVTMVMLLVVSLLTGCPKPAAPTEAPTAAPTTAPAKKFRVGMVSDVGGIAVSYTHLTLPTTERV